MSELNKRNKPSKKAVALTKGGKTAEGDPRLSYVENLVSAGEFRCLEMDLVGSKFAELPIYFPPVAFFSFYIHHSLQKAVVPETAPMILR